MPTLFARYRKYLGHKDQLPYHGMYEGNTPLVRSKALCEELGDNINLFFKQENVNPSYSFKDRGVSNAVAAARYNARPGIVCCSAGNLGISCAMYAARASIKAVVLIPKLFANEEKIKRIQMYDASVIIVDGDIASGIKMACEFSSKYNFDVVSHQNEYYCNGLKTIAFEICDQLGRAPDIFCSGVGSGALMGSAWRGFKEYYSDKKIDKLPLMIGIEAAAFSGNSKYGSGQSFLNSTILNEVSISRDENSVVEDALIARDESSGYISAVDDQQAIALYQLMTRREALIADISSCVSVAGLYKLKSDGVDFDNQLIVTVISGASDSSEILYSESRLSRLKVIKPSLSDLESELVL